MWVFKNRSLCIGGIYFLILLCIALWVRDIPNQPDVFRTTLHQLIKITTMGDPASFATAAIDIAKNGWISSPNDWIFNLWPPGFMLLEASIIALIGPSALIILVLQVLAAGLFSIVLVFLNGMLRLRVGSMMAFTLPLLIFAFPVSRVFLLEPIGISLGESFAVGFFLIFIFLTLNAVMLNSIRHAAYAGFCLALSAYFRSQFEIILLVLTGWGILLIIVMKLNGFKKFIDAILIKTSVKTISVTLLVAHVLTMPWRAYHWIYQGKPFWVATSSVMFQNSVMSSEYLKSVGAGWIVEGGGNLVCRINPSVCGDSHNASVLFFETFLNNPIEWILLKFSIIGKYWFSSIQNWTAIVTKANLMDVIVNGFLLAALIFSIFLLASRKTISSSAWVLLLWINASLLSAYALIFTLAHFESRYFYFPKIFGLLMLLIISSLQFKSSNQKIIELRN